MKIKFLAILLLAISSLSLCAASSGDTVLKEYQEGGGKNPMAPAYRPLSCTVSDGRIIVYSTYMLSGIVSLNITATGEVIYAAVGVFDVDGYIIDLNGRSPEGLTISVTTDSGRVYYADL